MNDAFSFYGVENWLLLRIMCETNRLIPFFRLHQTKEVFYKHVSECGQITSPLPFSLVSFVTAFAPDIEGIQNKVICF